MSILIDDFKGTARFAWLAEAQLKQKLEQYKIEGKPSKYYSYQRGCFRRYECNNRTIIRHQIYTTIRKLCELIPL